MTRQTLKESQHKFVERSAAWWSRSCLTRERVQVQPVEGREGRARGEALRRDRRHRARAGPRRDRARAEAKIRDVFKSIDTDSSNDIDQVELVVAFRQMGIELTEAESKKMIEVRERARTRARRDTLAIPCVRPRGARIRDARVPGREEYASSDPSSSSTHSLMMPHRTSIKIMTGSSANPSSPIA